MKNDVGCISGFNGNNSGLGSRAQTTSYFIVAVLGFSFWFFMVLPFASHRESYGWLAGAHKQDFVQQLSFGLSSTYRPLAQVVTWFGFQILDPNVFPTDALRQALLQGLVYGMFVLAWWLIYTKAPQRRAFALVACVAGGVFFSGYIQLFHIYGLFYVPVMLTLGALLWLRPSDTFDTREVWFAVAAIALGFWHPFATALLVGFYFGFYLDTFWRRSQAQHLQAVLILLVGIIAITVLVILFPRAHMPLDARLLGFLVSYQTNEVNQVASFVAFLLTQMVVFSMGFSARLSVAASLFVCAISLVFLVKSLPLLLLWVCAVLIKLLRMRCWSLFFLTLTAALLPFGGGIGTPIYALFAIILAAYVTPLSWLWAEQKLGFIKDRYVIGAIIAAATTLLMVRVGIDVPVVTKVASPLLAERERTYQLESILAWLRHSDYCGYEVAFAENAGSPIDDVESAITRRNRPPAAIGDVRSFWNAVLQCQNSECQTGTAIVTFGGPALPDSKLVFEVKGKYAGEAKVWIADSQILDRGSRIDN